jgi:hypothetical protein
MLCGLVGHDGDGKAMVVAQGKGEGMGMPATGGDIEVPGLHIEAGALGKLPLDASLPAMVDAQHL